MKTVLDASRAPLAWVFTCSLACCATDGTAAVGVDGPQAPSSLGVAGTLGAGAGAKPPLAGSSLGGAGRSSLAGSSGAAIGGAPAAGGSAAVGGSAAGVSGSVGSAGSVGGSSGAAGAAGSAGGTGGSTAGSGGAAAGGSGAGAGAISPPTTGPVHDHGALHVSRNRVVDSSGKPVQLRGMSLFWSQWSTYYAADTVDQLVDDWHATLVRSVLGIESEGYLDSPADNEAKVLSVVDRALERGVYAIIDWHDHHAPDHQAAAIEFFTRMAKKYGSSPGVIFEIYNEPMGVAWPAVKTYAQAVIAAIRGAGATNLVIVGTPNWSQDVDVAAGNPVTGYADVAYALHFYAATHKQSLRDKATQALGAGVALFVTEWGTCESSGDGNVDAAETKTWLDFLAKNQISWANWSLNDKAESCSALAPSAGMTGPWTGGKLTTSGTLVKSLIP